MKNLLIVLALALFLFSCGKKEVKPQKPSYEELLEKVKKYEVKEYISVFKGCCNYKDAKHVVSSMSDYLDYPIIEDRGNEYWLLFKDYTFLFTETRMLQGVDDIDIYKQLAREEMTEMLSIDSDSLVIFYERKYCNQVRDGQGFEIAFPVLDTSICVSENGDKTLEKISLQYKEMVVSL